MNFLNKNKNPQIIVIIFEIDNSENDDLSEYLLYYCFVNQNLLIEEKIFVNKLSHKLYRNYSGKIFFFFISQLLINCDDVIEIITLKHFLQYSNTS
jgi:hypothetical protein